MLQGRNEKVTEKWEEYSHIKTRNEVKHDFLFLKSFKKCLLGMKTSNYSIHILKYLYDMKVC